MKTAVELSSELVNAKQKSLSPWAIARRKFLQDRLAVVAACFLLFVMLCAFIAPFVLPTDLSRVDVSKISLSPSEEHWLGTDKNGRDVFTRLFYGGRVSLIVGLGGTLLATLIGTLIGSLAGYFGGTVDRFLMRVTDFVLVLPFLIFVIVLNTILMGKVSGVWVLILVFGFMSWGGLARIVRSKILSEKENEYIMSATSIGCTPGQVIVKHLLPNVLSVIIVHATLQFATMIVAETGLSFLGFGVPPEIPSWGNMLHEARESDVLQNKLWMWVPPAVAITLTILSIRFVGEGLKDALNPKSTR